MAKQRGTIRKTRKTRKTSKTSKDFQHLMVNAGAGTGKTYLIHGVCNTLINGDAGKPLSEEQAAICDAVMSMFSTKPRYITCVAFARAIADKLQEILPRGVKANTMHGFGYGTIKFTTRAKFLKVSGWKTKDIVLGMWDKDIRELNSEEWDQMRYIDDLVSKCKVTLAGYSPQDGFTGPTNEELEELCARYAIGVNGGRDSIFETVRTVLDETRYMTRKIDFDDMIWLPIVNEMKIFQSDFLMVDESQDLNRCQQEMAYRMGKNLMVVGDTLQAIFGFAGADSESFATLQTYLEEHGGLEQLPLMETRRCGHAIVKHAQRWSPDYRAHYDNPPGEVNTVPMADFKPDIEEMVLCRTNAPLVGLAFKLLSERRPVAIQGRDLGTGLIKLIKSFKVDETSQLVGQLDEWYQKEEAKILKRPRASKMALQNLSDKVKCVHVFCENNHTVDDVCASIKEVFLDDTTGRIRLSSIHRGKGLEADTVHIIEPQLIPHPMADQPWEQVQEDNLAYVAATRAINKLNYINGTMER